LKNKALLYIFFQTKFSCPSAGFILDKKYYNPVFFLAFWHGGCAMGLMRDGCASEFFILNP